MRRRRWIVRLTALTVLASACGGGEVGRDDRSEPTGGAREWLAVFETAEDPNELDPTDLLERVDTATVVSPARCFERGLEGEGIPEDHYLMGVVAETEENLAAVVERTGRDPVFAGEVTDVCGD